MIAPSSQGPKKEEVEILIGVAVSPEVVDWSLQQSGQEYRCSVPILAARAWKCVFAEWFLRLSGFRSGDAFAEKDPGHRWRGALWGEKAASVAPPCGVDLFPRSHSVGLDSGL